MSSIKGNGNDTGRKILFRDLKSIHIRLEPSFLSTTTKGNAHGDKEQSVAALNLNKEKLEKYNSILDNLHVTPDKISQEKYRLICRKRR
jgi:hypothetical protein